MHQACLIAVMIPINIAHHRPENFLKTSWDFFFDIFCDPVYTIIKVELYRWQGHVTMSKGQPTCVTPSNSCSAFPGRLTQTQLPELSHSMLWKKESMWTPFIFRTKLHLKEMPFTVTLSYFNAWYTVFLSHQYFTDDDKGYPEILLACLWPCILVIPIINRCFLALSHPRHSQGSRNILDFPPWCWWNSAQHTK